MVARSSIVLSVMGGAVGLVAIVIASAATGCGALIGIEDGIADPGPETDAANGDATGGGADAAKSDAAVSDASPTPDAASAGPGAITKPGGSTTSLPCGGMTCPIPSESCCAYRSSTQQGLYTGVCAATCAPPSGTSDRVSVLKCSGPANCPSATPRCCYHVTSGGAVGTSCETTCGSNDVVLCDPNGPSTCASFRSCQHFTGQSMPPSWGYCN